MTNNVISSYNRNKDQKKMKVLIVVLLTLEVVSGAHWALLVAGSSGYYNYRHQVNHSSYALIEIPPAATLTKFQKTHHF